MAGSMNQASTTWTLDWLVGLGHPECHAGPGDEVEDTAALQPLAQRRSWHDGGDDAHLSQKPGGFDHAAG